MIIVIVYWIFGYWAVNKAWFSRRVYITFDNAKFIGRKCAAALFFGWIAIPVAIIMCISGK
jgi:hypothetical protein